jgi:hypothetical protein
MTLLIAVLIPFLGAGLVAWACRYGRFAAAWSAGLVALAASALLAVTAIPVLSGSTLVQSLAWMPSAGLNLAFRLDGLGLMFAGLILGIGLLVIVYARYYLSERDSLGRLYAYLLLFMGSMLGVVLSENLIQMLIFWELTSLSSFLLIGYWKEREEARNGARMALAVTGMGGLALLGGILLLGEITGSYELTQILASGDLIRAHPLYLPALVLILLGAFTKSAQFPFHFWLPHAMAAPTPVSAYLHSATMVKAGVFLLARLFPALSGTWEWSASGGRRRPVHAAHRRLHRFVQARPEGFAGLFHHQPPGADHHPVRHRHAPGGGGRGVPHHQPRHLQGLAVHGRRHHRPRDRHPRHAPHQRPVEIHALHRHPGHGGGGGHGRGAPVQRLPVQGDVLRRGRRHGHPDALRLAAAAGGDRGRHLRRGLFAALRPRRVLQRRAHRPAAHAPRAAPVDEGAGGGAGGPVPAGGHPAGPDRGAHPGPGGGRGAARAAAPARSGHLARLQPGAMDERDRPGRRRPALRPTQAPVRAA